MLKLLDYLMIGHVTKDNLPNGAILGGTCSYSALTAHKLGRRVAMVTSFGADIPSMEALADIPMVHLPSSHSTTFENVYQNGIRHQKWLASSSPLTFDLIPLEWQSASIIHLGPLAQEIPPFWCSKFPHSLVCVTMQGWLRGRDADNTVIYQPHADLENWLSYIDVLVLSLADVAGDRATLTHFLTSAKLGIETLGAEGCRIYYQGEISHVPTKPEVEVDATGAGDIFAASFFSHYQQTHDPFKAAQFANACASWSVLKVGMASIPTLAEVEAWLR